MELTASRLVVAAALLLLTTLFLRILYILPGTNPRPPKRKPSIASSHLLIVMGSGGHTSEMLSMLRNLDISRYKKRTYIVSSGDDFSADRATSFESTLTATSYSTVTVPLPERKTEPSQVQSESQYIIHVVPRARKIFQSKAASILSSLSCLWSSILLLRSEPPDLVITNGPATGVIVVLAVQMLRFLGLQGQGEMRTVYVESWARTRTLSLSGKILEAGGLTDRFFVQWQALEGRRREWRGFLVE